MQLSSDSLNEIAVHLESHEESLRLKKLLFCLSKKQWENNLDVLNHFSVKDLIQEIVQINITLEQLALSLSTIVNTLNRPNVYTEVAKFIVNQFEQLYKELNNLTPVTQINPQNTQDLGTDFLVDNVVNDLSNHKERARIKKLIFSICKNRWENEQAVIDNYDFKKLILEFYQLNPTREELKVTLGRVVIKLNKQNLYLLIAQIIFKYLEPLYESANFYQEVEIETENQEFITQIIHVSHAFENPQRSAQASRRGEFETSIIELSEDQVVSELQYIQQVQPPRNKSYNLFEMRLHIMQYTNPLKAKILLFSILYHPWDRNGQDWSMLRSYTLDDLLEQIISSSKKITEIEAKLDAIAKSMPAPEVNLQTASTLIETLKPLF